MDLNEQKTQEGVSVENQDVSPEANVPIDPTIAALEQNKQDAVVEEALPVVADAVPENAQDADTADVQVDASQVQEESSVPITPTQEQENANQDGGESSEITGEPVGNEATVAEPEEEKPSHVDAAIAAQREKENQQTKSKFAEKISTIPVLNKLENIKLDKESIRKVKDVDYKTLAKNSVEKAKKRFRKFSDEYEAVVGIDINPHHIHMCEMRNVNGNWELSDMAASAVEGKSQQSDIVKDPKAYVEILKQLRAEAKFHTARAAIALPTSKAVVRVITIPIMGEDQLQQAIDFGNFWQNLVQIQNLEDYSIFHQVIKRDENRNTMDILFVAAKNSDIEVLTNIVKDAGFTPTIIDVSCFALLNATQINEEDKQEDGSRAPIAYLQFGPDENYLVVRDGYEPFLYDIYVSDQERKKLLDPENNKEDLDKFLQRYASQAKQLVANHEQSYQTKHISTLYVASSLPSVDNLTSKIQSVLEGYNVKKCDFFENIDIPEELRDKVNQDVNRSSWAVALGLAVHHLDVFGYYEDIESEDKINLLPGRDRFMRLERYIIEANIALIVVTILATLSILTTYVSTFFTEVELDNKLLALEDVVKEYEKKTELSKKLNIRYRKLIELDDIMEEISSNQVPVLRTYEYITDTIPEGVWLTDMFYIEPNAITLKGKSTNDKRILKFINMLNENKSLTRVSLRTMQAIKEKNLMTEQTHSLKSFEMEINFDSDIIYKQIEEENKILKTMDKQG